MTTPALPAPGVRHGSRPEWALYVLVAVLLALTTLAPLIRFGAGGTSVSATDTMIALVSLVAWVPFVALLLGLLSWQERRPAWMGWAAHLGLFALATLLHTAIVLAAVAQAAGRAVGDRLRAPGIEGLVMIILGVFQYGTVAAVLYAMRAARTADRNRLHAAELEASRAQLQAQLDRARTDALRARLQPHFLFNTLNSISVLTAADPAGAQVMIRRLSDLLRAVVADESPALIPLRRELELVEAYLAIQRVRFTARLRTQLDADPALLEERVPTFILQPLVENAIQHAVATREPGGSVTVSARAEPEGLTLTVTDDGPGCDDRADAGRGLGLRGTRDRLLQQYGSRAALIVARPPGGGCAVSIVIPLDATA